MPKETMVYLPKDCPTPEYHETHRYCPSCSWTYTESATEAKPEPIKRIYLAARYSRHGEMQGVRDVLGALGYEITSRWIDQHGGALEASYTPEKLSADPDECAVFGQHDVADLKAADTCISFTSADGGGKGGRHVEFGLALGLGKRLIVVGPRENIFHTLPAVTHYENWSRLVMALTVTA